MRGRSAIAVAVVAICSTVALIAMRSDGDGFDSICEPPFREGAWPGGCWRPYSNASPFNRRVPDDPTIASWSERTIARLVDWGPVQNPLLGTADSSADYGHPVYYAQPSDPVYSVRCTRWTESCAIDGHRVRVPAEARPAGGGDGHMAVVDYETGWEYDFWRAERPSSEKDTIEISHGGRTRIDGDGLGSNATAAHFGLLAGIVRPQELRARRIRHALFVTVRCSNGMSVPPAGGRTSGAVCDELDQPVARAEAPPMGARLWLDLSPAEIAQLDLPVWKRVILRALNEYGGYVGDTIGGDTSFGVLFESGSSYTSFGEADPWVEIAHDVGAGEEDDYYVLDLDSDVDWARHLHVLEPCHGTGTC